MAESARIGRVRASRALFIVSSALCSGLAAPAMAQSTLPSPLLRSTIDTNNVDLASGTLQLSDVDVAIGAGRASLANTMYWRGGLAWQSSFDLTLADAGSTIILYLNNSKRTYTLSGSVYVSDQQDGSTVTKGSSNYTYVSADGTSVTFDKVAGDLCSSKQDIEI